MKLSFSCVPLAALLAAALCGSARPARAAERTQAATVQYNVAAALQGKAEYEAAAEEWNKFLNDYKTDPRCDHAMRVCREKEPPFVAVNGNRAHHVACWLQHPAAPDVAGFKRGVTA